MSTVRPLTALLSTPQPLLCSSLTLAAACSCSSLLLSAERETVQEAEERVRAVRGPAVVCARKGSPDVLGPSCNARSLLFDFYFKTPEMSEWEKKLNAFTVENFSGGIRDWASIHTELRARKLKTVKPEAVAPQVKRKPSPLDALLGPPPLIVDVRDAEDFARAHPSGAVNVPLYTRLKEPRNAYEWYRTISFAIGLGMRPPVRNKQFLEQLAGFTGGKKDTPIFVICGPGGTLETKDERKLRDPRLPAPIFGQYGAASRSLIAAHDMLVNGGYKTVSHVEGGYAAWCSRGLDIE
jgi:rhodanese-related sulfurtransferase